MLKGLLNEQNPDYNVNLSQRMEIKMSLHKTRDREDIWISFMSHYHDIRFASPFS